jgi:aspartate aminotransferase
MAQIPRPVGSLEVALQLLEQDRVVTVPGVAFGAEGWLRLSWAGDPQDVQFGLERLQRFFSFLG